MQKGPQTRAGIFCYGVQQTQIKKIPRKNMAYTNNDSVAKESHVIL